MQQFNSVLRRNQVEARTGLSRSTIYLRIKEGTFPKPINLGARAVGWLESEVEEWLDHQIKQSRQVEAELPRDRNAGVLHE